MSAVKEHRGLLGEERPREQLEAASSSLQKHVAPLGMYKQALPGPLRSPVIVLGESALLFFLDRLPFSLFDLPWEKGHFLVR